MDMISAKNAAYPPTKLMEHWYTKAIHIEEPEICAFLIDPGTRVSQTHQFRFIRTLSDFLLTQLGTDRSWK